MAYVPHNSGALMRARREMLGQLRRAGAFSADTSTELDLKRGLEQREFNRMLRRGVIRPGTKAGYYWLDREHYSDWRRQQILFVVGVLMVTLAVCACLMIYAPDRRHHHRDASAASPDSASPVMR